MRKRKKRYLRGAKRTEGFDQFNELKPLVNKNNIHVDIWHSNNKAGFVGESWCTYNYISHGDGHILVGMTTHEKPFDSKSHSGTRKTRFENWKR